MLEVYDALTAILAFFTKKLLVKDISLLTSFVRLNSGTELKFSLEVINSVAKAGDGSLAPAMQKILVAAQEQIIQDVCEKARGHGGSVILASLFSKEDWTTLLRPGFATKTTWSRT